MGRTFLSFGDDLFQSLDNRAGRGVVTGLAVIGSEHQDEQIHRGMAFQENTDRIQSTAAFPQFIGKDGSSSTETFFNNTVIGSKLF